MANYECTFRTNYFGVKDEKIFQDIVSLAKIQSEDLVCYPSNTEPGKYMLGGEGAMVLYANGFEEGSDKEKLLHDILQKLNLEDELKDNDDDIIFDLLSACVRDDDAILYKEGGYEKLRYVQLTAGVITSKGATWLNVDDIMLKNARTLLNNPEWSTQADY